MPVILSVADPARHLGFDNVVGFLVEADHVTFRGLKFVGTPDARVPYYYPIARASRSADGLEVSQCLFVGEKDASPIQAGILAMGHRIVIDHCIFHNVRNPVVFYFSEGARRASAMRYCIVTGAYESAIWTAGPDEADFEFSHNVIVGSEAVWVRNPENKTVYRLQSCHLAGNRTLLAEYDRSSGTPKPTDKVYLWNGLPKQGGAVQQVAVVPGEETPRDYLHLVPGTPGYELGAGLFHRSVDKP